MFSQEKMDKLPILEGIKEYLEKDKLRLHMPGHKGNPLFAELYKAEEIFLKYDLTEVKGLDDLHQPEGIILAAQEKAARIFGTHRTFFLINGASVGIEAALLTCTGQGGEILLPRNAHRSALSGLILAGAIPHYLTPRYTEEGLPLPLNKEDIEPSLIKKKISTLFLTSPTYEGITADYRGIKAIADQYNLQVIVDEAHGAHFNFNKNLPESALQYNFDIVIHGSHKTLGSLTQSAMLHLNNLKIDEAIQKSLQLLQSTSPSYLLLASLDIATEIMQDKGEELLAIILEKRKKLSTAINKIKGFFTLEAGAIPAPYQYDMTKLVIFPAMMTGYKLANILSVHYGIEVEMAGDNYILAMLTVGDYDQDLSPLVAALREINSKNPLINKGQEQYNFNDYYLEPQVIMSPRNAFFGLSMKVSLKEAVGRICGDTIVPYPPGIPLLAPGELIKKEHLEILEDLKARNVYFQGAREDNIITIIEEA